MFARVERDIILGNCKGRCSSDEHAVDLMGLARYYVCVCVYVYVREIIYMCVCVFVCDLDFKKLGVGRREVDRSTDDDQYVDKTLPTSMHEYNML